MPAPTAVTDVPSTPSTRTADPPHSARAVRADGTSLAPPSDTSPGHAVSRLTTGPYPSADPARGAAGLRGESALHRSGRRVSWTYNDTYPYALAGITKSKRRETPLPETSKPEAPKPEEPRNAPLVEVAAGVRRQGRLRGV
ncbi:hypothetical protein TUSST3_14910 [Streptomyces sp. TUS-ST3]|nr:hypothetical protein TUSST3_14910 [Streptomyces sp. TUS-ST3]